MAFLLDYVNSVTPRLGALVDSARTTSTLLKRASSNAASRPPVGPRHSQSYFDTKCLCLRNTSRHDHAGARTNSVPVS